MGSSVTFFVSLFPLHLYESNLYDLIFRIRGSKVPGDNIVTIKIDDKSIDDLGINWPLPLSMHSVVLRKILAGEPQLVAYTMVFNEVPTTKADELTFNNLVQDSGKVLFASNLPRLDAPVLNPAYIPQKEIYQNGVAIDRISFAQDSVARRHVARLSTIYSIESAIAKKVNSFSSFDALPEMFYINYLGPEGTFKAVSFSDVYKGKISPESFKNKIVLINRTTSDTSRHFATTPFDKNLFTFTKLEIQANVLQNILTKTFITKAPSYINILITFIACIIAIILTMETHPVTGLISLSLCGTFFFLLSFVFHVFNHTWVNSFHPLLVIFISYYILIPYRLLKETRKRVAIEKDREALTRVEKFKTNFISLMSHDLKTPIARIHGTAEVILHKTSGLPEKFVDAINRIMESSEDLLHFVNNILSVAKIESRSISLNRESKDVNNIIRQCIKNHEYMAKIKNIKIEYSLEPLFSIKIDVSLIRQVISTLLENAIKYSPEGSTIHLASSERNDSFVQIQISDSGSGIPASEQDLVFTKFYRGNRTRTNPIKGTGLGLYLAKYFVELHKGKIELSSMPDKGSTFSVYLPLS